MSKRLPWYKRDVDAWRGGTRSMSIELRGFYSELLDAMWDLQGPIPSDPQKLGILISCNARTVRKLLPRLLELRKLVETPYGLMNRRMEGEITGVAPKTVQPEFERNSSGIRGEFERKNTKKPMNSTRAKEEELRIKKEGDLIFEKKKEETERQRLDALAYQDALFASPIEGRPQ